MATRSQDNKVSIITSGEVAICLQDNLLAYFKDGAVNRYKRDRLSIVSQRVGGIRIVGSYKYGVAIGSTQKGGGDFLPEVSLCTNAKGLRVTVNPQLTESWRCSWRFG